MASITHLESNLKKALGAEYSVKCVFESRKTWKNTESTKKSISVERADGKPVFITSEDGNTWTPNSPDLMEKYYSAVRGFQGTEYEVLREGKVMEVVSNFD